MSAGAPGVQLERLAAHFAAKEAVMKALTGLRQGVRWRDIEIGITPRQPMYPSRPHQNWLQQGHRDHPLSVPAGYAR